jgi:alpha-tubulin suppressor-like RCC1 family protein
MALAVTKGEILAVTWGYNSHNLLGRKTHTSRVPDKVTILQYKMAAIKLAKALVPIGNVQHRQVLSTFVMQAACTDANTVVLLNGGEVMICGSSK